MHQYIQIDYLGGTMQGGYCGSVEDGVKLQKMSDSQRWLNFNKLETMFIRAYDSDRQAA